MKNKLLKIIITTVITLALIVVIGPLDIFSHGFYVDVVDPSMIAPSDITPYQNLDKQDFQQVFTVTEDKFKGFSIYLTNISEEKSGQLIFTITADGEKVDEKTIDISNAKSDAWYPVYMNKSLDIGKQYALTIREKNCSTIPYLQMVDEDYLPDENVSGNLLMGYAYAKSTYSFPQKIMLSMYILGIYMIIIGRIMSGGKVNKKILFASLTLFLTTALSWNYMYSTMDNKNKNERFPTFQSDSESLVSGVLQGQNEGVTLCKYGLANYDTSMGNMHGEGNTYLTNEMFFEGYGLYDSVISVSKLNYTEQVCQVGNYVRFANGEILQIESVTAAEPYLYVKLKSDKILNRYKYGYLLDARFLDSSQNELPAGEIRQYESQYGLQGKVFRILARHMNYETVITHLHFLCSVAAALVFTLIVLLLAYKYNKLIAGLFYITFWLSPWIVNFVRNLYWVEFTWFIPMLIGLFCSIKIDSRKCRIVSYSLTIIAITLKCLCGYEYISTIMMGLIAFLLTDLVKSIMEKDKKQAMLVFRTTFFTGLSALAGFAMAIFIHANLRGEGNLVSGLKKIWVMNVVRKTSGGELDYRDSQYWDFFGTSAWDTVGSYFHFATEIITGIAGNLFPLLCIAPLVIFVYNYFKKRISWNDVSLYIVFFITSVSWLFLARIHAIAHPQMNYVMWYFGFVQICLYIICKQILTAIKAGSVKQTLQTIRKE